MDMMMLLIKDSRNVIGVAGRRVNRPEKILRILRSFFAKQAC
jgi:hypothetical protein